MKRFINTRLIIVLITISINLFAQTVELDSVKIHRIAKTCQLWGEINYFHPFLMNDQSVWYKAFTESIEGVINANSEEQFQDAVQSMLNYLDDPATFVIKKDQVENEFKYANSPSFKFVKDSMLYVDITNYKSLDDFDFVESQFDSLKKLMPHAKSLIFDLRYKIPNEEVGWLSYYFQNFQNELVDTVLTLPGLKGRFHDGFAPENGNSSGGYYSGYFVKTGARLEPGNNKIDVPIIFIVNSKSELPLVSVALQKQLKASIVSVGLVNDYSIVESKEIELSDQTKVAARLNELIFEDGSSWSGPNVVLPENISEDELLNYVLEQIIAPAEPNNFRSRKVNKNYEYKTSSDYYPDLPNRLLALSKSWTVINNFHAYKELMTRDWEEVLLEYVPKFVQASDSLEYHLAVAEMYSNIEDGHGSISSAVLNKYFGEAAPPLIVRMIEEKPVITYIMDGSVKDSNEVSVGDEILEVDGKQVKELISELSKYKSASNSSALQFYICGWALLDGPDSSIIKLKVKSVDDLTKNVNLLRTRENSGKYWNLYNERFGKPIIQRVTSEIGYADLDRLTVNMVDSLFNEFNDTKAIIFDMRGYPKGTAWTIAPYLTTKDETIAANFRRFAPKATAWGEKYLTIFDQTIPKSSGKKYNGLTVMLIDERTQSQAEHTGLFLKAANNTKFIGSTTAGANGDVTNFSVPGNIRLNFSGHDVRFPDGTQLQKVGLKPDIEIKPTINGIRAGNDEILEKAIEYLNEQIHNN